jgi:uncharacterized protein YndB with AHSA1/START domain
MTFRKKWIHIGRNIHDNRSQRQPKSLLVQQNQDLVIQFIREFATPSSALFSAIADGTVFRLTGAKQVTMDFCNGGQYYLDFGERNGKHCFIEGHFVHIVPNSEVSLIWNVDGFRALPDKDTMVTFRIIDQDASCILELKHEKIKTQESADGKWRGWDEILTELKAHLAL